MATIQEIQAEIRKLRAIEENKRQIEKIGLERIQAERELKRLRSPRLTSFKRKFVRANVKLGTKLIQGGKITGKFLNQAAKNIAEAERQEEIAKRRRPKTRTKTKTKKSTSKRKTTKTKTSKRKKR